MRFVKILALAAFVTPCVALAADPAAPASAVAPASAAAPAGGMDMSKMGPWARKPKNEAAIKKEIAAFFKTEEELHAKGDLEALAARVDFPVYMATDDATGKPESALWTKEQWMAMMKPMYENMPKDMKLTHKPTLTVLSDSIVVATDDFTMKMGKDKLSGRNAAMLVKIGDQWKWKVMVEAGWGGDHK